MKLISSTVQLSWIALFLLYVVGALSAQEEQMELVAQVTVPTAKGYNDCWGLEHLGVEYAVIGTTNSTAVFSLESPSSPQLLLNVPGSETAWRDIKNWGPHIYVTSESDDGILHIDLSDPDRIKHEYLFLSDGSGVIQSAHNAFIDSSGRMYVCGSNVNMGGVLIFDVSSAPADPIYLGATGHIYSHDVYVKGQRLYASNLTEGLWIYDISDVTKPRILGKFSTGGFFTHNAWSNDDGTVLYTTDETDGDHLYAWQVEDPDRVELLSQYLPYQTERGEVVHNVHFHNDFLVVSYYTDGLLIFDAANQKSLPVVERYQTWQGPLGGFNGCWGAFPYYRSGLIVASDRVSGLFVLRPSYERATLLTGQVLAENGSPISGAKVFVLEDLQRQTTSDADGFFSFNFATGGQWTVVIQANNYGPMISQIQLARSNSLHREFVLPDEVEFQLPSLPVAMEVDDCEFLVEWDFVRESPLTEANIFVSLDQGRTFEPSGGTLHSLGSGKYQYRTPIKGIEEHLFYFFFEGTNRSGTYSEIFAAQNIRCFDQGGEVNISPNPVRDILRITSLGNLAHQYELFDQSGRLHRTGFIRHDTEVDMTGLPQGIYFVSWKKGEFVRKIVKI